MRFRIFHRESGPGSPHVPEVFFTSVPVSKEYPRFSRLSLPTPASLPNEFSSLLEMRKSERFFDVNKSISQEDLSSVLHFSCGTKSQSEKTTSHYHPSGGALYPLECYVAAIRVEGVPSGIYHYHAATNALETLPNAQPAEEIMRACDVITAQRTDSREARSAPAAIVILTSVWGRNYAKYAEYSYFLSIAESGHAMQNLLLAATARTLKSCPVSGFDQRIVADALDISNDDEDPLYLAFLGK